MCVFHRLCHRARLSATTIDAPLAASPTPKSYIDKNAHPDLLSQNRSAANVLSDPIGVSDHVDMAADEIAELVSQHSFKFTVDEGNAALIAFKQPGSSPR